MHIIIAALGAIVSIVILLNRLSENGIDIGRLNPFSWHRRRKYRLNHDLNPAFKLPSPLESTALLLVTIAKADGDISVEQKSVLLNIFTDKFHLTDSEAKDLMRASVHLFGSGDEILAKPARVLDSSLEQFNQQQIDSMTELMTLVAHAEGQASQAQLQIISQITNILPKQDSKAWS